MNADTVRDLSEYILVYCRRHVYRFPSLVSEVAPGEAIVIHTGAGENAVTAENTTAGEYQLYVGSETPLLANEGMQLVLKRSSGTLIDSITYPEMDPGGVYGRLE